jgi:hypothetical protein
MMTNHFISYMSMKDWFVWESPRHLMEAQAKKTAYEHAALRRIFGDLIGDIVTDTPSGLK